MIWRAYDCLAIIQRDTHNLGVAFRHTRVDDALNADRAVFTNGVAEVLFSLSLFCYDLLKAQAAPVGERDLRIARKATTCGIALNDINFTPCRVGVRAVGELAGQREALHRALARGFAHFLHRQARRSEEHTSELQSRPHLVCRLLLEK